MGGTSTAKVYPEMPTEHKQHRYRKKKIPKALREAVWLKAYGRVFDAKCSTTWCPNNITTHDFQAGHCVPESKGGPTTLENLVPLCSRCTV